MRRHLFPELALLGRSLAVYVLLPCLLTRAPAYLVFGERQPINLDFLALGVASAWLAPWATAIVYAFLLVLDVAVAAAPIFHFELGDVASALVELLRARPAVLVVGIAATALAALVVGCLATRLARPNSERRTVAGWLAGIAVLLWCLDALNGTGDAVAGRHSYLAWNIAGSSVYATTGAMAAARDERARRKASGEFEMVTSATAALRRSLESDSSVPPPTRHIALILVESLGAFRSGLAKDAVLAPLLDDSIRARYDIRTGVVPYSGPTTAGEFRELCGVQRTYLTAPAAPLGSCLPEMLRARGFRTIAIHGFRRGFFRREKWYPIVGFDRSFFRGDIASDHRECGTIFAGVCDSDAARAVSRELLEAPPGERRFVYWLTLTSHFPVDRSAAEGSTLSCDVLGAFGDDEAVCLLMRIWHRTLGSIREIALEPELPPTRFVVVGDHGPPLAGGPGERAFVSDSVPFVELVPR